MGGHHTLFEPTGGNLPLLVTLDGRVKISLLSLALVANLRADGVLVPGLLAGTALLLAVLAEVSLSSFLKRMLMPALMAFLALATQLVWVSEGPALYTVTVPLVSSKWLIHAGGLQRGLALSARIVGGTATILLFSLTTPLPELMRAARFFRAPSVLVELAVTMYRCIFLFLEEGQRIKNAQKARLGFTDIRTTLRSSGTLGAMLVFRSYDRAERSFNAMRCRGYR
ncbi:MAG: cobalt ECF transporter T component CbiQ, partial [Deltaproteobacteria bacterium]|nr:cobalt ECF transporter T component CbiQ [Deltaproteobacteria bacterium]